MRQIICSTGIAIPSLSTKLIGYPSLSPDADILQISFSNLPSEYGRKDGGLDQLRADMITNLEPYGTVLDSGIISGSAGLFSGRGYAILERPSRPSSQSTDAPGTTDVRPLPPHKLDWTYPSVNNNEISDIDLDTTLDRVLVYATFASMAPYCRYCHSEDHPLVDCPVKLSAIVCYNCNAHGHKSRSCPRKNATPSSDVPNKKARKTPNSVPTSPPPVKETLAPPRASVDMTTPEEHVLASESALDLMSNSLDAPSSGPKTPRTPPSRNTQSQTASNSADLPATDVTPPNTPPRTSLDIATKVCRYCGLIGHLRTNHNDCLKNPRRQTQPATTSVQLVEQEDQFEPMQEDDIETVNPSCDAPIDNDIIMIISNNNHNNTAEEPISVSSNIPNNTLLNTHSHAPDTPFIPPLKMATLNCRGLRKTADSSTHNHFIRYIRTHSLDILALQETHASTTSIQNLFHNQFQASESLWSHHCGLISFSPHITFSNTTMSLCGRIITTTISHKSHLFSPVTVSVLYAPASRKERYSFLADLLNYPSALLPSTPVNHILMGDFNYTYSQHLSPHHLRQAPKQWLQYIEDHFVDGVTPPDQAAQPTFCRGVQSSCIDFIFLSKDLPFVPRTANVTYIQPVWTDHFMVSIQLEYNSPPTDTTDHPTVGKGLWRANPLLASNKDFCAALKHALSNTVSSFIDGLVASYKWETLKATTKKVAQSFSRKQASSYKQAKTLLQNKLASLRKKTILFPEQVPELQPLVNVVERQLADIQQYHVEILALRSGIRWRELGELSAGYLKRTIATRASRQMIPSLIHPVTKALCSSRADMFDAASTFYANLPIVFDDILEGVARCPSRSSPGTDGLPYELLRLIITHPECRDIALTVYNDVLSHGIFPLSWLETSVSLIPKKGSLSDLKNWRPISLINTDAKVFTRILSAKIISCVDDLITPYKSGFLRHRFIADNGLLMKLVMDYAKSTNSKALGLLLDQEKAYDRVHPDYLQKVLTHFGFSPSFIQSVLDLFFGTQLLLNINGFLSNPVHQQRRLLQGDPLSPVLFNLAFEPLLRKILNDLLYNGFSTPRAPSSCISDDHLQPIKLLAYADDVLCLLKDPSDLTRLQTHLDTYSQASKAKVNFHKMEALSLSGSRITPSSIWHGSLLSHRISH
ncbi:hypothetical protein G6F47_009347 [Rhizopus delemar]|nr:hypothetical protein G6F47_009347 [Rhizopus delemar]